MRSSLFFYFKGGKEMALARKCDICGKYFDYSHNTISVTTGQREGTNIEKDACNDCASLFKDFIESQTEGTVNISLLDYLISVYGEDKLLFMLKQRGDKNGETEN